MPQPVTKGSGLPEELELELLEEDDDEEEEDDDDEDDEDDEDEDDDEDDELPSQGAAATFGPVISMRSILLKPRA